MTDDRMERGLNAFASIGRTGKTTRRGFGKLVGLGVGAFAASGLIAACGDEPDVDEDDDEEDVPDDEDEPAVGEEPDDETDEADVDDEDDEEDVTADEDEDEDEDAAEDGEPQYGGTFRMGFDTSPEGFDPHDATNFASLNIFEHVYDTMFEFDEELELVNSLCESYEVVDEVTYQFEIRDDVTFHDGKELTAEDVKYSFERMIDPDNAFPRVAWFGRLDSVEVDDDHTCTFTLSEPFAPFLNYMGIQNSAIVDQNMVEEHGDLMGVESANGTGPFRLVSYDADREARLEAFEDHWREGIPYLDEIQWMIQSDEQSRVAAIRADEADMVRVFDVQNAQVLSEEFTVHQEVITSRALSILNCRREPLDDPRVRQALAYAINREDFIESAMFGEAEPVGFLPTLDPHAVSVDEFDTYTQNIERAQELLEEAGYGDGFELHLVASPQYAMDVTNAEVLQSQLQQINVTVDIEQLEWGTLLNAMREDQDWDILNIILTFQGDPDGYTYQYFHSESSENYPGIEEPELDELLEQGRQTVDQDERMEIYAEIQQRLSDEWVPKLPYFSYYQNFPAQDRVRGWTMRPSISYKGLREVWLED
jgi:peptide/nickel transport system substrate-binding protein